ncbi:hypothetical protein, partial [Changpingibacter yushuensis]|uniref:hypothetical protein n=1 Tax=Changpingibacter yushuensis TaxID=2758440 RepID=UPI0021CDC094
GVGVGDVVVGVGVGVGDVVVGVGVGVGDVVVGVGVGVGDVDGSGVGVESAIKPFLETNCISTASTRLD